LKGIASNESGTKWNEETRKWVHVTYMWNLLTETIGRGISQASATIKGVSNAITTIRGIRG